MRKVEGHFTPGANDGNIKVTCPGCKSKSNLSVVTGSALITENLIFGQAYCPDNNCMTHIFYIKNKHTGLVEECFPEQLIDFDSTAIPDEVKKAFEESLICFSHKCFIASAILVRKTIELICSDKAARGKDLKAKIKNLGSLITLPKELLDAMDELRLLGNDAAHVESKAFSNVTEHELNISIEFVKEILKSVYQYQKLLSDLRSLKGEPKNSTE